MVGMFRRILVIVMFLLLGVNAQAVEEFVPEVKAAKIRGDGMLVDDDNLISGIRNVNDPRNTDYEFYYIGVDAQGNLTDESAYKVYQDPESITPRFLQESLMPPEEVDYSQIINQSASMENAILVDGDAIFFNGERVESGDVLSGGVMTYVNGKLYYQGNEIQSGAVVFKGEIVN